MTYPCDRIPLKIKTLVYEEHFRKWKIASETQEKGAVSTVDTQHDSHQRHTHSHAQTGRKRVLTVYPKISKE